MEGKRHGQWVLRKKNGSVEHKYFVEGTIVGNNAETGVMEEGNLVNGKRHGNWIMRKADGDVEEGPYVEGQRQGHWVYRFANGDVWEGPIVDGKKHGAWTEESWQGVYVEGERHGQWVKRYDDGQIEERGLYVDGKRDGRWVRSPGTEYERFITYDANSRYDASQVDPIRPKMVAIPGGRFRMGCVSGLDCDDEEFPVHEVQVEAFELGKYEVTFEEYDRFTAATGRSAADDEGWGRGRRPVINVSWEDAVAYTRWLSEQTGQRYRLPSEAEWEYAARAGTEAKYSWGNQIGRNRANCDGCGSRWDNSQTAPVGWFGANGWGLHDMHGNVWEWVQDCWNDSYRGAPTDGSAWQQGNCSRRVLRGGSWYGSPRVPALREPLLEHHHDPASTAAGSASPGLLPLESLTLDLFGGPGGESPLVFS